MLIFSMNNSKLNTFEIVNLIRCRRNWSRMVIQTRTSDAPSNSEWNGARSRKESAKARRASPERRISHRNGSGIAHIPQQKRPAFGTGIYSVAGFRFLSFHNVEPIIFGRELWFADAPDDIAPEVIATDVLGLMKQDVPEKRLELLILLLNLLNTVIKYSPSDELRGSTLPLSMLPLFFNIQVNVFIIVSRLSNLLFYRINTCKTGEKLWPFLWNLFGKRLRKLKRQSPPENRLFQMFVGWFFLINLSKTMLIIENSHQYYLNFYIHYLRIFFIINYFAFLSISLTVLKSTSL